MCYVAKMLGRLMLFSGFALGAIVVTWPLVLHPSDSVLDAGDPLFTSWIVSWVNHALFNAPRELFHPPVFYPERWVLLYSEALLLPSILISPVLALGGSPILANNVLFFISFVLAGVFFYWMGRELGLSATASVLGAVLFDFGPYRMDLSHVQLAQIQYFPLQILLVHRYFRERRVRDLIFAWLAFAASTLSCSYYGVYALLLMALLHLFYFAANARTLRLRTFLHVAASPLPAAVILVPVYLGYAWVSRLNSFNRSLDDMQGLHADIGAYATFFYHSLLFPNLGRSLGAPIWPYLTPGIVGVALMFSCWFLSRTGSPSNPALRVVRLLSLAALVAALIIASIRLTHPESLVLAIASATFLLAWLAEILLGSFRQDRDRRAAAFGWIAVLAAVLSLGVQIHLSGRVIGTGIYGLFHSYFPGFWGIRAVYRVSVLFFLCGSTVAAFGVDALRKRGWLPRSAAILLVVLGFAERINSPIPYVRYRTRDPEAYAWLKEQPDKGAVLELPLMVFLAPYATMYESIDHGRPILNGVSGFIPTAYYEQMRTIESWPSDSCRDLLEGMLPLGYVIRREEPPGSFIGNTYDHLDGASFLRHAGRFGTTDVYAVRHDFGEERDRSILRLYVDRRIHGGTRLEFDIRPGIEDDRRRRLEIMEGSRTIESVELDRSRHVSLDLGRLAPRGCWIQLRSVVERSKEWQLLSWHLISDIKVGASSILLEGGAIGVPQLDGLLLVATDGHGSKPRIRFVKSGADASKIVKIFLTHNRAMKYRFVVAYGRGLADAPETLRDALREISGTDPGRGAMALALPPTDPALNGWPSGVRIETGESRAELSEGDYGFILTNLRIR